MKTILITGFDPFGGESVNPAWEAVKTMEGYTDGDYKVVTQMVPTVRYKSVETAIAAAEQCNPDFILYDQFNKDMLGAIRDNLDVVDRQLEIMYDEISHQTRQTQIGMDEVGFKQFVARSINELVNRKMRELDKENEILNNLKIVLGLKEKGFIKCIKYLKISRMKNCIEEKHLR